MWADRYRRQILVKEFGKEAQDALAVKHVTLIGGGGLGSHSAELLVRMGIGSIAIIDNDVVDETNLHRTGLFTEEDLGNPKALVLQQKLQAINSEVQVMGIRRVVIEENIQALVRGADVILDGTDSLKLRYLINDVSIKCGIPWVYAGVCDTVGMTMGVVPKKTPCLQCISQELSDQQIPETPVLGTLPATIAAIQCNETLKLLLGKPLAGLIIYDVWNQCFQTMALKRNPACPVCVREKWKVL
ncbi:MAG TPA: HesA/MoeB/ThiF family protein [Candidatus Thermoplasmatota archaeon]|nr:HesA/MoeB/ThiF family protein [Candidatus Thermoplasmatota archaeon]